MPAIATAEGPARSPDRPRQGWFRLLVFGPVVIFFAIGLAIHFADADKGELTLADFRGKVVLLNIWATWCVACREEHPVFIRLKARGILPIHGLNYKDRPDDAARWLDEMGDPYTRTGADIDGRVAIDWGVYGVPETFVIDRQGHIAFKQVGPITPQILETTILPLVARLQEASTAPDLGK